MRMVQRLEAVAQTGAILKRAPLQEAKRKYRGRELVKYDRDYIKRVDELLAVRPDMIT